MAYDYSKMKYRPDCKKPMVEEYPELSEYSAFKKEKTADAMLRYAIILYDQNSPLFDMKDFDKRKEIAFRESGLEKLIDTKKTYLEALKFNNIEQVNEIVYQYLTLVDERVIIVVSAYEAIHNLLERVRKKPEVDDEKAKSSYEVIPKCFNDAIAMQEKARIYRDNLLEENIDMAKLLKQVKKKEVSKLSAESFAKTITTQKEDE